MKRIQHRRTKDIRTVTDEQWKTIVANGFESDFKILPDQAPPKEVAKQIAENQPEPGKGNPSDKTNKT